MFPSRPFLSLDPPMGFGGAAARLVPVMKLLAVSATKSAAVR